jgi:hypothetical protein
MLITCTQTWFLRRHDITVESGVKHHNPNLPPPLILKTDGYWSSQDDTYLKVALNTITPFIWFMIVTQHLFVHANHAVMHKKSLKIPKG